MGSKGCFFGGLGWIGQPNGELLYVQGIFIDMCHGALGITWTWEYGIPIMQQYGCMDSSYLGYVANEGLIPIFFPVGFVHIYMAT